MHLYVRALCAVGAVLGIVVTAMSCGTAEATYDSYGKPICEEDYDCYHGWLYEPGTRCIENRCVCPVEGDIQCCKKDHEPGNCDYNCRSPSECEPGEHGAPEDPPPPPPECTTPAGCPGPPDKRCGSATCEEGKCGVVITEGPIDSQRAGDCKRSVCNEQGLVVEEKDLSDYYDDGAECTFDYCDDALATNAVMVAITCPESGEGFCSGGACVECVTDLQCELTEDCSGGHCLPKNCINDVTDGTESDEDCGGKCAGCVPGKTCIFGTDCKSGVCVSGQCATPTCNDGAKNDGETDEDCGATCKADGKLCAAGKACKAGDDCASGVCWAGKCQAPTCTDAVMNGDEAGIDCGGPCPTEC